MSVFVCFPVKWDRPPKPQLKLLVFLQAATELSHPSDKNSTMSHQSWVSGNFYIPKATNTSLIAFELLLDMSLLQMRVSSVQFSHSVVSNSLQPHGLQHTRLPCPSPTPGAYSNLCPSKGWVKGSDVASSRLVIAFCPHASLLMSASTYQVSVVTRRGRYTTFQLPIIKPQPPFLHLPSSHHPLCHAIHHHKSDIQSHLNPQ